MANVKRLQEYLQGTCVLYQDIDWMNREDKKGFLADLAAEGFVEHIPFVRAEKKEEGMLYVYNCPNCEIEHEVLMPIEWDFLYIGQGPADDDRYSNYTSWLTCQALLIQLTSTFGNPPEGAELRLRQESGYIEIVCYFNTELPLSMAYAFMLEGNLPEKWSQAALDFLKKETGK